MTDNFVNLHNYTYYSFYQSLVSPGDLIKKAKDLGQTSVALTDSSCFFAVNDAYKASLEHNIKLIVGCEFNFVNNLSDPNVDNQRLRHIILIAKNHTGYKNLLKLNRAANDFNLESYGHLFPRIDWNMLFNHSEGLICTTSGGGGILSQLINTRNNEQAWKEAKRLKEIFGPNLGLEIQPNGLRRNASGHSDYVDQILTNNTLIKIGKELDIKVFPASETHYLDSAQAGMHDVLTAMGAKQSIKSGQRLRYLDTSGNILPEFYLKSREEVAKFFRRLYPKQVDEWCDNTLYFDSLCENPVWVPPQFTNPKGVELPEFPVKDQSDFIEFSVWKNSNEAYINAPEDEAYIRYKCQKSLETYPKAQNKMKEYQDRLEKELDVFSFKGVNSYMLIVTDYLEYCRKNNIPVGPGRGSVGGSLAGFLLNIHQADPIQYDLIFERFFNKDKAGFADVDSDISKKYKKNVEKYIATKYGQEMVASISNIMRLTPKPYARAISRVFQFGGTRESAIAIGNALADAIPNDLHTMEDVIKGAPLFMEYTKRYPELLEYVSLGGIPTTWAKHAAGIVIGKRPLASIVGVRRDKDGYLVLEYEKERAEENGLLKMDLLGLETLDIIKDTEDLIKLNKKQVPVIDYDNYDEKTYDLINRGDTNCVFQLGTSGGTVDLCRKMNAKSILEIGHINALARPGVAEIRQDFIDTKDGKNKFALLHPKLERAFKSTYGFGIYEECLIFLAADIANWSLSESDNLRKLTKLKGKYPEKVAKWRKDFIEGAINNGIPDKIAIQIWTDIVDKFGKYAFNRSHAVVYSFISYLSAYFKAHFPLEFLTANLIAEVNSNTKDAPDNAIKIKQEIRALRVNITPPNINTSDKSYTILSDSQILSGLDGIKFLGKNAIPEIVSKRPFTSLQQFLISVEGRKVTSGAIQGLAASGALDSFGMTRKQMFLYGGDFKKKIKLFMQKNPEADPASFIYPFPDDIGEFTIPELYALESKYLGEGLTGTPSEVYPNFFDRTAINLKKLPEFFPDDGTRYVEDVPSTYGNFQGVIEKFFQFKIKKEDSKMRGEIMGKMDIRDPFGNSISCTLFPKELASFQKRIRDLGGKSFAIEPGVAIHFGASINYYEGKLGLVITKLKKLAPPPALPAKKDLEAKSIKMKISGPKKPRKTKTNALPVIELMEEVDDELLEMGLDEEVSEEDIEYYTKEEIEYYTEENLTEEDSDE